MKNSDQKDLKEAYKVSVEALQLAYSKNRQELREAYRADTLALESKKDAA